MSQWLKITYDSSLPGESLNHVAGKKRKQRQPGRWIVFDKAKGEYPASPALHDAESFDDAYKWLEAQR